MLGNLGEDIGAHEVGIGFGFEAHRSAKAVLLGFQYRHKGVSEFSGRDGLHRCPAFYIATPKKSFLTGAYSLCIGVTIQESQHAAFGLTGCGELQPAVERFLYEAGSPSVED